MSAAPAVALQHLVKKYGHLVAVEDVSLSIDEGEIFGIIGPNGAGKTTTVECISGLRTPSSGSISVYGLSPRKDRNKLREFVGVRRVTPHADCAFCRFARALDRRAIRCGTGDCVIASLSSTMGASG